MTRHTIVLVEDELLTLRELETTIDWAQLGLQVVGTASDGISGEALIKSLEPDIVITDIRLPGQDGLSMLAQCPVNHAIILSGHSDFSYMQQAIRLGVFDYLLKPVDNNDLHQSLEKLLNHIKEEEVDVEKLTKGKMIEEGLELPQSVGNYIVDAAIEFIRTSYAKQIGLQETAEYLNISESHLCRLFKEYTQINFLQYISAWRINKAIELMGNPSLSIQAIALNCGFPNPGYFAKIFKKFMGISPSKYRNERNYSNESSMD